MIYVLIEGGNGFCGCNFAEAIVYEDGTKEYVWADEAYELALQNAESYEHVVLGWDCDCDYTEEEYEQYYENIKYSYRQVTRKEYLEFCEENGITPVKIA